MIDERMIRKLASKMDQDDLAVLGGLLQKVAADSAQAGAHAKATEEQQLHKLASDLVAQGYSDGEIVAAVEKIAEQKKVAAECGGITQDCLAMGTLMGKQASAVQMQGADEIGAYIGKVAAAVCVRELQGFASKHAMDEESEAEKKEDEDEKTEEEEDESEKEASTNRRVALLRAILQGSGLEGAISS